jgi:hypothetical protein
METYLKIRIWGTLTLSSILAIWGFFNFFTNGNTGVLKIALVAYVIHLSLYYFFLKKKVL